jgi:hypothetical protein
MFILGGLVSGIYSSGPQMGKSAVSTTGNFVDSLKTFVPGI